MSEKELTQVMSKFGFNKSTGRLLKGEKIRLREREIYLYSMEDGSIKLFLQVLNVAFSCSKRFSATNNAEIMRQKRTINNKLLPKIPLLE